MKALQKEEKRKKHKTAAKRGEEEKNYGTMVTEEDIV